MIDDSPLRERYRALLVDGRITPNTVRALESIPVETRDRLLEAFEWLSDQMRRVGV